MGARESPRGTLNGNQGRRGVAGLRAPAHHSLGRNRVRLPTPNGKNHLRGGRRPCDGRTRGHTGSRGLDSLWLHSLLLHGRALLHGHLLNDRLLLHGHMLNDRLLLRRRLLHRLSRSRRNHRTLPLPLLLPLNLLPLPLLRLNALRWNLIGPRRHDGGDGLRSTSGLLQASELIHGDRVAAELRGLSRRWNPAGRRRDPKTSLRRDVAGRLRMARDPPHP